MVDTVIKNCKIVNHYGILDAGLAIDEGRIVAIAREQELPSADTVINAEGNYVIPGLVDAHVHLENPPGWGPLVNPSTNLRNETQQYAVSGCTTVIEMLSPTDNILEKAEAFINDYESNAYVDLAVTARIYNRTDIKQIKAAADWGIAGFKLLLPYKGSAAIWKGSGEIDDGIVYLTFKEIAHLNKQGYKIHAKVHCENIEIFNRLKESFLEEGREPLSWHDTRPSVCEEESIRKCIYLAGVTGCNLYVVHMTIKEGVDLIAKAKAEGINVIAETIYSHLVLNVNNTDRLLSKTNPPIRTPEDNKSLWEGIQSGVISVVATDSGKTFKEKKANIWDPMPSLGGSETFLPAMLSEGVNKGKITLEKLVEVCCYNPAKISGITPRKGLLSIGSDADIVVIDLGKEATVPEMPSYSASDYSILAGWKLKGWPTVTMIRGKIVARDGKVVCEPGYGRHIRAITRSNS